MSQLTVAAFMERALYDATSGYYSAAAQRSGREGDFFTSVDAGSLFGEMVAVQALQMLGRVGPDAGGRFDLVEAGAGNGRLARDVLDAIRTSTPEIYERLRVTVVERSASARAGASVTLATHLPITEIRSTLPPRIHGVLFANELLDALPVHLLEMTDEGLREVYIREQGDERALIAGPISDPRLREGIDASELTVGTRFERSLAIPQWFDAAAAVIDRGFVLLFDYVQAVGRSETLAGYTRHTLHTRWFDAPGTRDITALVDLPAARASARGAGFDEIGCVDQTYFLTALGILDRVPDDTGLTALARRMNAKALILPGGLGSVIKVLGLSKGLDGRNLRGFTGGRLT